MILVSKDKKTIANFDNIAHIFIPEESSFSNGKFKICYGNLAGSHSDLGEYATEERAKEVLQEIVNKYKLWNKDANNAVTIMPKVYEMPKE